MLLRVSAAFFSLLSLKYIYHIFFSVCCVFRGCRVSPAVSPWLVPYVCCVCAPEALRRPSVCPAVCRLVAAVTRPSSGAKQCGSVGRCTAYMSPAFCPLVRHVLPLLVPLSVPCLVLPSVVSPQVAIIVYTPLYPGRRRCGAASEV